MYIMCVCLAIFWGYDGDTVGICGDIYIYIYMYTVYSIEWDLI